MRLISARRGDTGMLEIEHIITIVHAAALVFGAPIDIAMSRYASDCLYAQRPDRIAAPLRRVLTASLLGFSLIGCLWMVVNQVPWQIGLAGTTLLAVVGSEWLLLSAAGGLASPGTVLRAYGAGAPISMVAALALSSPDLLGARGYLYGFWAGQVITLTVLLFGTFRALPDEEDEHASILPRLREYTPLILAAFCIQSGIWIDKLLVYLLGGSAVASHYAGLAALAWFSVVPTFAYVYVKVETGFYEKFRAFYGTIHSGATLTQLAVAVEEIERDVKRILIGAALVQGSMALISLLAAPHLVGLIGMTESSATAFRILVIGAMFQSVAMCSTLLLYYFDLRREAMIVAGALVLINALLTLLIDGGTTPMGIGYALACAVACVLGTVLLRRRLTTLLRDTFQLQPYASG
jgi:uncharacterized membrane protein